MKFFVRLVGLGMCLAWVAIWVFLMAEPPGSVHECSTDPMLWEEVLVVMLVATSVPSVIGYATRYAEEM